MVMTKRYTGEIGWRPDVYPETEQDKATAARQDARFERAMRRGEQEVIEEVSLDEIEMEE